ncbi:unnamed protein product [Pelagomonas calceolata]|uniref:Uncharacterized protein n=1 Tax=Pelagomonas calceolata TaxID=35677 RepID=A0A8J2SQS2_9STRA|nr:unnamed protein product [Pelagomonas calceolata]
MRTTLCAAFASIAAALRTTHRRALLLSPASLYPLAVRAEPLPSGRKELYALVADARRQLDPVPGLLEARKWDSVRAILITPPLSDCWGKNARPLLRDFAAALGDSGGDELAALEAREDAMSHLRYLDMAVYNNVFSPAGGDAAVSASKDLVRQYVELPAQELAASTKALDILVDLGKVK